MPISMLFLGIKQDIGKDQFLGNHWFIFVSLFSKVLLVSIVPGLKHHFQTQSHCFAVYIVLLPSLSQCSYLYVNDLIRVSTR